MIDADRLRAALNYDPATGVFTRRICTYRRGVIPLFGERHYAHRLAWLYMTGEWPSQQIDHINGIRGDNRWENLRDVAPQVNSQNLHRARRGTATGVLGVTTDPSGKFKAQIREGGKNRHIGLFDDVAEAGAAYQAARRSRNASAT